MVKFVGEWRWVPFHLEGRVEHGVIVFTMGNDTAVLDPSSLYSLVQDTGAKLAFTSLVTDAAGASVLHVDGSKTSQLIITITNQSSSSVTVQPLTGTPSSDSSNIIFTLPSNQLYFYTQPTIDAANSTPGTWALATDSDGGWLD